MKKILSIKEVKELDNNVGYTDKELSDLYTFYKYVKDVAQYFEDKSLERRVDQNIRQLETFINQRAYHE